MQYAAYNDDFIFGIGNTQEEARTAAHSLIATCFQDKPGEWIEAKRASLQVAPISPQLARLAEDTRDVMPPFKLNDAGTLVYDHDVAEAQKADDGDDDAEADLE